jgi:hypothetical protein
MDEFLNPREREDNYAGEMDRLRELDTNHANVEYDWQTEVADAVGPEVNSIVIAIYYVGINLADL